MNNGGLIHETMDCLSYLCYLKNWGKSSAEIKANYTWKSNDWGIPKPDLIQIDEDEGVSFIWHDITEVVIEKGRYVRVYFYDNSAPEGFWHFRFEFNDLSELTP